MRTDDFDYELDESLIAQVPILNRDESRLMLVDKETGFYKHEHFKNIINYLRSGDVLVLNNTRVIPARIIGSKEKTGAVIELLILKSNEDVFECLVKPARRINIGDIVSFGDGKLRAKCTGLGEDGIRFFEFLYDGILMEILDELGSMPLPPYIHEKLNDSERYQTVYSKVNGSSAAPTAGLHFTKELLNEISAKGIEILYVTLHVGLGTFRPVKVDNVLEHKMHSEYYEMSNDVASKLNLAKSEGRRIISVGTTSTRVLETVMHKYGKFCESKGDTDIFIYPGFKFMAIDSLITNFHLPKSTLMMLVSALAGKDNIKDAYRIATQEKYRFFSFGDSMMISDFNSGGE